MQGKSRKSRHKSRSAILLDCLQLYPCHQGQEGGAQSHPRDYESTSGSHSDDCIIAFHWSGNQRRFTINAQLLCMPQLAIPHVQLHTCHSWLYHSCCTIVTCLANLSSERLITKIMTETDSIENPLAVIYQCAITYSPQKLSFPRCSVASL